MNDQSRTKPVLIQELASLRKRITELEQSNLERKRLEEELLIIKRGFESASDAIGILDIQGHHIYQNKSFTDLFEYTVEELEAAGGGRVAFSDINTAREVFDAIMNGRSWSGETEMKSKSGRSLPVFLRANAVKDDTGRIISLFGTFTDITERKLAEEAFKDRAAELTSIYENAPFIMILADREWKIQKTNVLTTQFVGRAIGDTINLRCGESLHCIHLLDTPEGCGFGPACGECTLRLTILNTIETGQSHHEVEVMMSLFKGEKIWDAVFLLSSTKLTIKREPMALVSMQDITERKQAEEALHRSEENFRHSLDDSPLGIRIVTAEGETIYANRAILNIYGYDSMEELNTTPVEKRYTPESYAEFHIRREERRQGMDVPSEYTIDIIRKDGEVRHLKVYRKEILWDDEKQFQVLYSDVTKRKRAEERIQASLREKELLLRELHHRVKNNMQVICSLLDLQASSSKNPELIAMLHESQSRIQAMTLVHEKLYGSKDYARIDLVGYVRTLSQELFQSHKINQWKIALIIQNYGAVYTDISKAIPCGLILNELISNALKHAFPGGRQGELRIIIRETKNTEIEIAVCDNGLGLPDDVDINHPRTVGLHLVNGLVKNQLDGQMEVIRDAGTEFRIKFPL